MVWPRRRGLVKKEIFNQVTKSGEPRNKWDELLPYMRIIINQTLMEVVGGPIKRANHFLGSQHYKMTTRLHAAEETDKNTFSLQ